MPTAKVPSPTAPPRIGAKGPIKGVAAVVTEAATTGEDAANELAAIPAVIYFISDKAPPKSCAISADPR